MSERSQELREIVEAAVTELMHHFDTVMVLVTLHDSGSSETESIVSGEGHYQARYGLLRDHLIAHDEQIRLEQQKRFDNDEEDDE